MTSIENLMLADTKACRGKGWQRSVQLHQERQQENILKLQRMLLDRTYCTSTYTTFPVFEPKQRLVYRLPYFPDRIAHHAAMNILEPIFVSTFTADTYSCIKGRGIRGAREAIQKALKDVPGTIYCLKLDIRKFYPSIDHDILKQLLRRKIKDPDMLWFLDEVIDSADGLPIGNYLSQYLANYYLTFFDHWLKEKKGVRYYFRYADDCVFLAPDKASLHLLLADIREYLAIELKLIVKDNYQIFPVAARGIDFVGYVFFHTHTLIRKSIKQRFARMMRWRRNKQSVASYWGWLKHANTINLRRKFAA
jgi:retron-type reverse transcriptase